MLLKDLVGGVEVINRLVKVEVSPRVAYKLHQFATIFESDIAFFNTEREKILNAHGIKSGDKYTISEINVSLVRDKLESLGSLEIEKKFHRINVDDITIKLPVEDIQRIAFLYERS